MVLDNLYRGFDGLLLSSVGLGCSHISLGLTNIRRHGSGPKVINFEPRRSRDCLDMLTSSSLTVALDNAAWGCLDLTFGAEAFGIAPRLFSKKSLRSFLFPDDYVPVAVVGDAGHWSPSACVSPSSPLTACWS